MSSKTEIKDLISSFTDEIRSLKEENKKLKSELEECQKLKTETDNRYTKMFLEANKLADTLGYIDDIIRDVMA